MIPLYELTADEIFGDAILNQINLKIAEVVNSIMDDRAYIEAVRSINISINIHPHEDGLASVYVKVGAKLPPIQVLAVQVSLDKPKDPVQQELPMQVGGVYERKFA